ncbi:MAG: YkgJ family cysteine cluster protein [Chitinophagales bacterium]|nr:YkgJ family cysteine cluster protein [Chitinophagales bacterium]MDW8428016.1 YkgJ family cysteine cluster protein [Chitinophagales bacterium]
MSAFEVKTQVRRIAAAEYNLLPLLAKKRTEENLQFFRYLQRIPATKLDELAMPVASRNIEAIDCTQCANCCKTLEPGLHEHEIAVLAKHSGMDSQTFQAQHIHREADTGIWFLRPMPCLFLRQNRCTIYEVRPECCRDYPHLLRQGLKFRLRSVLRNYTICPIVFNTLEELKMVTGFFQQSEDQKG